MEYENNNYIDCDRIRLNVNFERNQYKLCAYLQKSAVNKQ